MSCSKVIRLKRISTCMITTVQITSTVFLGGRSASSTPGRYLSTYIRSVSHVHVSSYGYWICLFLCGTRSVCSYAVLDLSVLMRY